MALAPSLQGGDEEPSSLPALPERPQLTLSLESVSPGRCICVPRMVYPQPPAPSCIPLS